MSANMMFDWHLRWYFRRYSTYGTYIIYHDVCFAVPSEMIKDKLKKKKTGDFMGFETS